MLNIKDSNTTVPLVSISVEASLVDVAAQVTIEQVYVNNEDSPIEAVYKVF